MTAEVVNEVTGEVIETITETEARRLTTEARSEFRSASDHHERAWTLVTEAVQGGGHLALGYRSPGDYLAAEFDGVLSNLDVAARRIAVREMTGWGLSTRAIAPVVGASKDTVQRDRAGVSHETPAPEWTSASRALADIDQPSEPVITEHRTTETTKTVGIDGKSYPKPQPSKPRRRPLPDAFSEAAYKLSKVATTITNLSQDDRFPKYAGEAAHLRNDLARSVDALQRVIDQLS